MFQIKSFSQAKKDSFFEEPQLKNSQGFNAMFLIYFFLLLCAPFGGLSASCLTLGQLPINAVSADFNQDGFDDLAIINIGNGSGSNLTIYLNDGQGNFTQSQQVLLPATGNLLSMAAVADFTGNGRSDLVVSSPSTSQLFIFLNNGDGTFIQKPPVSLLDKPTGIAVGNFRGLGKRDIAVINAGNSVIDIYFSNGNGTFTLNDDATFVSLVPTFIATGDLNQDGLDDLVVASGFSNDIHVFFNNGSGTFPSVTATYPTQIFPACIAIGDLNNDGYPDIAVTNMMSNSVSVLINQGKSAPGSFLAAVNYATQFGPFALTLSDLNENGLLDIVVTNEASSTVSVLVNNGDGTFQSAVNQTVNNTPMSITSGRYTKGVRTYFTLGIASTTACTQSKNSQFSLSLVSSVNPSYFGQIVTFTAKASGSTGGTTPVGTIVFTIDGVAQNPVALVNGQAFTVISSLSVGAHTVKAFYSGDLYYPSATSSLTQTVIAAPIVCPPRDAEGVQKRAMTACGWDRYNVISWKSPSRHSECSVPKMYYIYRDASLTDFVACVPGKEHKYIDRHLVKGVKYTYYIVAVDALGIQSKPVKVTVRPHH